MAMSMSCWPTDFYPRPLRGGRRGTRCAAVSGGHISIHALCEEGDSSLMVAGALLWKFLSTPSARRATLRRVGEDHPHNISIHALCELGDEAGGPRCQAPEGITIHALCEEGDGLLIAPTRCLCNFYPRPLRGGRRMSIEDYLGL